MKKTEKFATEAQRHREIKGKSNDVKRELGMARTCAELVEALTLMNTNKEKEKLATEAQRHGGKKEKGNDVKKGTTNLC